MGIDAQDNSYIDWATYRLRLLNLSQRNRAVRHTRLSSRRDVDLVRYNFLEGVSLTKLLENLLNGNPARLLGALNPREPLAAELDQALHRLHRELGLTEAENGTYDLAVGYPFVEGRFADGTLTRCPLLLVPVRLLRQDRAPRWRLEPRDPEAPIWNTTFFRAYEKYSATRLSNLFYEFCVQEAKDDLQGFLNHLYLVLKESPVALDFRSSTVVDQFTPWRNYLVEALRRDYSPGQLVVVPHAVLGIYPQAATALLPDYHALENDARLQSHLAHLFSVAPQAPTSAPMAALPVDESQQKALETLRTGVPVVVHGPPGTGKSQWIVNAVCDALAHGKRVLVVSQKRAALDVVHERLLKLQLGPFVQLIHDHRNDRARVYARLAAVLDDLPRWTQAHDVSRAGQVLAEYEAFAQKIAHKLAELDRRQAAMLSQLPCGLTALELYGRLTEKSVEPLPFGCELTINQLEDFILRAGQVALYNEFFSADYPWRVRPSLAQLGPTDRSALLAEIEKLPQATAALYKSIEQHTSEALFREDVYRQASLWQELLQKLRNTPEYARALGCWLSDGQRDYGADIYALQQDVDRIAQWGFLRFAHLRELGPLFADHLRYTSGKGPAKWLFGGWRRARHNLLALLPQGQGLTTETLAEIEAELKAAEGLRNRWLLLGKTTFWTAIFQQATPAALQDYLHKARSQWAFVQQYQALTLLPNARPTATDGQLEPASLAAVDVQFGALLAARQAWDVQSAAWESLFGRDIAAVWQGFAKQGTVPVGYVETLKESLRRDWDEIQALDRLLEGFSEAEKQLWNSIESDVLNGNPGWEEHLRQGAYACWLAQHEHAHQELAAVSGRSNPQDLELLRTHHARLLALAREAVRLRVQGAIIEKQEFNRLGNAITYREIAHQVSKRRKIWPLRKLVERTWDDGLAALMPCVLASPETVAAVFPLRVGLFDLVVFDEASQLAVERAIPVLVRARQAAVAGDAKQLPPLDLFSAGVELEIDDDLPPEAEAFAEAESLLDLAVQCFTPTWLTGHYRSQQPELIAFSNRHFYEGRLQALPGPVAPAAYQPPVQLRRVQGLWEGNRNRAEAQAAVAEVRRLLALEPAPSIGIVTFNRNQQDLILDELEAEHARLRSVEPGLAARLHQALTEGTDDRREPLWVKNIENVQGNERDVVVFSIGYAPDRSGQQRANFGLLNLPGGENRLNVAVTRSRWQEVVLCSFDPHTLHVAHTAHAGPKLLKQYLLEAAQPTTMPQTAAAPDARVVQVAEALQESGLTVRILPLETAISPDIAAWHPATPENVLGIVVEAPRYLNGPTALARQVSRPYALRLRGWQLHWVWARNWWRDPAGEVARVQRLLAPPLA